MDREIYIAAVVPDEVARTDVAVDRQADDHEDRPERTEQKHAAKSPVPQCHCRVVIRGPANAPISAASESNNKRRRSPRKSLDRLPVCNARWATCAEIRPGHRLHVSWALRSVGQVTQSVDRKDLKSLSAICASEQVTIGIERTTAQLRIEGANPRQFGIEPTT